MIGFDEDEYLKMKERIAELERKLELCEASKKDMQRMVINRDDQLKVAIKALKKCSDFEKQLAAHDIAIQALHVMKQIGAGDV